MAIFKTILEMLFSPEGFISSAFAFGALRGLYKAVNEND